MEKFTYKDGDRVHFKVTSDLEGYGTVVGCANISVVIVGATYMIKPDVSIKSETYPFDIMPCQELFMKAA